MNFRFFAPAFASRVGSTLAAALACLAPSPARAWDAVGHRIVTVLALEAANRDQKLPAWLTDAASRAQIADQSVVPDRWRSTRLPQLVHVNSPDHYINLENLEELDLTLETLPTLRYEYVKHVALKRADPGFKGRPINPAADPERIREYPGFLPHAMAENYAKLQSAFRVVRILEGLNDPARKDQLAMARANAYSTMGVLAHYVGDAAQPLHTTKHYNGWVGDNPKGYTTERTFHAQIDGVVIREQHITEADARPKLDPARTVQGDDPWKDILAHIQRGFARVDSVYELKKTGELDGPKGKEFLSERLADGASTLGAMYRAAYDSSEPKPKDVEEFLKYDNFTGVKEPRGSNP
jgi:hypothetical protein